MNDIRQQALKLCERELNQMLQSMPAKVAHAAPRAHAQHLSARAALAFSYFARPLQQLASWLVESREDTNFTYDLDPKNIRYIAASVAHVCGVSPARIREFAEELRADPEVHECLQRVGNAPGMNATVDVCAGFGRRIGWYCFVRALKPRVVVETGVDKGLGSLVLTAALRRNESEGFSGYYYGTDINPEAGVFFQAPFTTFGRILYGDSLESLGGLREPIDLFINDSDHSAKYEAREYECIAPLLHPGSVILGDNAHCTDELCDFAERTGRHFLFMNEVPRDHWYPGAGNGVAFSR